MNARDTAGVIAPPPLIALGAVACGWAMEQIAPMGGLAAGPSEIRWPIAVAIIVLGILLIAAAIFRFQHAGTPVQTRRPSTTLVTNGVYSLVRNPIYVGFFLIIAGIAVAASWDWLLLFALVFLAIIHWGVVLREERYLSGIFGDAYASYRTRVRRYGLF